MKGLNQYIVEANQDINLINNMTLDYINMLGINNIKSAVVTAINKTNNILKIFNNNEIADILNMQMIGRIIEKMLAECCNFNGFMFQQGSEFDEKDINCTKIGEKLPEKYNKILTDISNPHNYGIELKCTSYPKPIGNKSYAIDNITDKTRKNKQSFYIIITNIKYGKGTNNVNITNYKVYFGFLRQSDWKGGSSGNAAYIPDTSWRNLMFDLDDIK